MKIFYMTLALLLSIICQAQENKDKYSIELAPFNTKVSDFGASFYEEGIVFASNRDSSIVINRRHFVKGKKRPFYQLFTYDSKKKVIHKMKRVVNKKYHESTVAVTSDGNTMYFTRNNYFKGKFKTDNAGLNRLKIFKVVKVNGNWTHIEELPFNSDLFSTAHPTLNADETKLYFASDREGTYGLSDIYYVAIKADNSYGEPVNLGSNINTTGNDTFPFLGENNDLYFSSDGHPGRGGLDVFESKFETNYSSVQNLGNVINGAYDDFNFIIKQGLNTGYFSSNRMNGIGDDDIYKFVRVIGEREEELAVGNCDQFVTGEVVDQRTKQPILGALITLKSADGVLLDQQTNPKNNRYKFKIDCEKDYIISAEKETYTVYFKSFMHQKEKGIIIDLILGKIEFKEEGGRVLININPIYFDFDKDNIRPDAALELEKVLAIMNKYPGLIIESGSHTDARGNDDYNRELSSRRARSTVSYLINRGISSNRISGKGYGEYMLTNHCSNDVRCSKKEHQLNRRTEFVILNPEILNY